MIRKYINWIKSFYWICGYAPLKFFFSVKYDADADTGVMTMALRTVVPAS
jgi:hypothetical protein